jgi:dTDP-4-dehydrorhamnose 3,5-epimerase
MKISLKKQSKIVVTPAAINGVLILESTLFKDERGWFSESFNAQDFLDATSLTANFVQDNHSFSKKNVLRGLHYQFQNPQGKLVRVVSGEVLDVVVDLRKNSDTFGHWIALHLSANNYKQLWVPPGIAHGFLVLSDGAEVLYKTTEYYHPQSEVCLAWDDPTVNIQWPLESGLTPILNAKDLAGLSWDKAPKF